MKKHILKIASFAACLGAGILFAALLTLIGDQPKSLRFDGREPTPAKIRMNAKIRTGVVEVRFKGYTLTEDGPVADFVIENNSPEPQIYQSYLGSRGEPVYVDVKIDGKKVDERRCGTGLIEQVLEPGQSINWRFYPLAYNWKPNRPIQIGIAFKKQSGAEYRTIWSETLPISDTIALLLLKQKNKLQSAAP